MTCSFGVAPSTLVVTSQQQMLAGGPPAATIMDNVPMTNIPPFGMCTSIANPQVASATSAASGVLTPQPCVPSIAAPWAPGSPNVLIAGKPALNLTCKAMCNWAGVITIVNPGQTSVIVP